MTDGAAARPRARAPAAAVAQASLAAFAIVLALLVLQLRAGRDPALGPGRAAAPRAGGRRRGACSSGAWS